MLNDFRQSQFALARYLRNPLAVLPPEEVTIEDAIACTQAMAAHLSEVLDTAFPVTHALLGEDLWQQAVRLFLKEAPSHAPWAGAVQRAFVAHVSQSPSMQGLPAWLQDLAHYEWLQNAVSTASVNWPAFDVHGDVMQRAVVLNPTHVEAVYEWPLHGTSDEHKLNDMQHIYVSMLRDVNDELHVFDSSMFRSQLLDLLREGQTGVQALLTLARWLSHPEPETFVHEAKPVMLQLQREGVVLGTRV